MANNCTKRDQVGSIKSSVWEQMKVATCTVVSVSKDGACRQVVSVVLINYYLLRIWLYTSARELT